MQQQWADYLGSPVRVENSIGMRFVLVPAGEFQMGLADPMQSEPQLPEDSWRYVDPEVARQQQLPRHRVVLTSAYYFGETEVTFAQFERFVNATDYVTDAERASGWGKEDQGWLRRAGYSWKNTGQWLSKDDHPVMNVSWNDAVAFAQWLGEIDDLGQYRLPTEAEWEFACRAGTETTYYFGDDPASFHEHAWYKENFKIASTVLGRRNLIRSGCTICTAIDRSGARTCSVPISTSVRRSVIPSADRAEMNVFCAVARTPIWLPSAHQQGDGRSRRKASVRQDSAWFACRSDSVLAS